MGENLLQTSDGGSIFNCPFAAFCPADRTASDPSFLPGGLLHHPAQQQPGAR